MKTKLLLLLAACLLGAGGARAQETWTSGSTTVTLSNGVLSISGTGAMANYTANALAPWHGYSFTSVVIEDGVTRAGNYAFHGSPELTSVTIGNSVTAIGNSAFHGCGVLPEVTIPNSVTTIGGSAFRGCAMLTSVTIGSGVTSIDVAAFIANPGLIAIEVAADNPNYASENGVLFNKSKTILWMYPGGKQGAYSIPNSVTRIGYTAFWECLGLTAITIHSNVTTIDNEAFVGCLNLTSVTSLRLLPPTAGVVSFAQISPSCCLYVPAGALDAYTAATGWDYIPCKLELPAVVYIINFDAQGGTSVGLQALQPGQLVQQFIDPSREGYTFVGWYTDAQGTTPWNFALAPTAGMTLYAKWQEALTVSFDVQGGNSPTPMTQTVQSGQRVQQPATPLRTGHAFAGWYREAAGLTLWNFATNVVHYSMTLYAKWLPLHTVAFNAMGGSIVLGQVVPQGQAAPQPAAPTRGGFTFAGWYRDVDGTQLWDFATDMVKAPITLYAKWINNAAIIVTVSFNAQGGSAVASQQVAQGSFAAQPGNPAKAGFTFGGWYTEPACTNRWSFGSNAVTGSITLYALWLCTVQFNANGGSGRPRQVVPIGGKVIKPADPTHINYNFTMWYSDLCLATPWDFENGTVTGDMMMYAGWAPK